MVVHPVMDWLAAGVPLSLLMDLAGSDDPDSDGILRAEASTRCTADMWLTAERFAAGLSSL
ncbi:MAG: hypothetical protein JWM93_2723 [Frankiales bacterium]|nr:hypothetical protein [Frankiales bacterium]